jgi:catechol 2,3-dioxygenase-like lactoylglutathione lyase family enzyme
VIEIATASPAAPDISRIYETVLYGSDVEAMKRFYADVLTLRLVDGPDELSAAFRLPDGGVLLIFDPARSGEPGRAVPSHGATGPGHIAFHVPPGALDAWRERLDRLAVEIEREVSWGGGRRSLYVRDPDGNSVELTEDELWPA